MPLRFDDTDIPGLFSTDGYVWLGERGSQEIAQPILERMSAGSQSPPSSITPTPRGCLRRSTSPISPLVSSVLFGSLEYTPRRVGPARGLDSNGRRRWWLALRMFGWCVSGDSHSPWPATPSLVDSPQLHLGEARRLIEECDLVASCRSWRMPRRRWLVPISQYATKLRGNRA
jgi:hypothetical protein